jgi:hypothetical protein
MIQSSQQGLSLPIWGQDGLVRDSQKDLSREEEDVGRRVLLARVEIDEATPRSGGKPEVRVVTTWRNDNPRTIWNQLAARLGREPTDAEATEEVKRILQEEA